MKIYTPEDVFARTECRMELVDGQIIPKEASEPLDDEVLAYILSTQFDIYYFQTNYIISMASLNHTKIMRQLSGFFWSQIPAQYAHYVESLKISTKIGFYRIPDLTVTLLRHERFNASEQLENPISIIEVLSPSTEKKDQNEKREEYQAIESLQEYVLISQNAYRIVQYFREGKTKWIVKIYDSKDQTCILTVGIKISLKKLYEETDWAKNEEDSENNS
jgi:Uma2 family endonuclease